MNASLTLFLDLGDMFTKGSASGSARCERVRFPSVIAHELLRGGGEMTQLSLNESLTLPRLSSFEATRYPRTRSFRGSDGFVKLVQSRAAAPGARFAGAIAAVYGADRQLFGLHPTLENVDALVRKAFLLVTAAERCSAELVLLTDLGPKADLVRRYAQTRVRDIAIEVRNYRAPSTRTLRLSVRTRCMDAMACARSALPQEVAVERVGRTLLVDIGYLRSKLAIVGPVECEHQEQLETLGVSDCVYRILRDGQEQGLVDDEFAVIRALEACAPERFEIAGRRFDVRPILESARRALEDELLRRARRIVLDRFARSGEMCRGAAIIGGGASLVGSSLARRLKHELELADTWVGAFDGELLLAGARRIASDT